MVWDQEHGKTIENIFFPSVLSNKSELIYVILLRKSNLASVSITLKKISDQKIHVFLVKNLEYKHTRKQNYL